MRKRKSSDIIDLSGDGPSFRKRRPKRRLKKQREIIEEKAVEQVIIEKMQIERREEEALQRYNVAFPSKT